MGIGVVPALSIIRQAKGTYISTHKLFSGTFRNKPWYFLKGTAVQIGGVLRRFPFFKAWKPARKSVTNGERTNWRRAAVLFRHVVRVGGS